MVYKVCITVTDEGFTVSCPELPGCWSQGDTYADALANIQMAIEDYLDVRDGPDDHVRDLDVTTH